MPSLSSTTTARILSMPTRSHEGVGALQVLGVLAVVLNEATGELEHVVRGVSTVQSRSPLRTCAPGGAADVDLPLAALRPRPRPRP